VEKAGWGNGWGNYVTIKHTLSDGTTIYSNYAHLSELAIKAGEKVRR
jgi:murein DD-endopeptidase MepM/ murein hydrolase activator NlpD